MPPSPPQGPPSWVLNSKEDIERFSRYRRDVENRPIEVAVTLLIPSLRSFISFLEDHISATSEGGAFEDYKSFDSSNRRIADLASLLQSAQSFMDVFQGLDQAEIDEGREQIFNSVDVVDPLGELPGE